MMMLIIVMAVKMVTIINRHYNAVVVHIYMGKFISGEDEESEMGS